MKILLLGLGKANKSIEEYFKKKNIEYDVYDDKNQIAINNLSDYKYVIKSPGIKNEHFLIKDAIIKRIPIITDLEYYYLNTSKKNIITVTGTNGKTTTTSLIRHVIQDIDFGGNIGIPIFDVVDSDKDIVIEASSFMLEYIEKYHSKYNIFLNCYKNHIDHHLTFNDYIKAKMRLFRHLKKDDYIIYNYDDIILRRIFSTLEAIKVPISLYNNTDGCYLEDNYIYYKNKRLLDITKIKLIGQHNIYNIMACLAVSYIYKGISRGIIKRIKSFTAIEHRMEYAGKYKNINIYNDSKSTNPLALKTAISALLKKRILLICGGKEQDDNIEVLNDKLTVLEVVLVYGENKNKLKNYFLKNEIRCFGYDTLEEVIRDIEHYLLNVEVILFSPGTSSYDQYNNFEERGVSFKNLIKKYLI